jgi:hypothetical protein
VHRPGSRAGEGAGRRSLPGISISRSVDPAGNFRPRSRGSEVHPGTTLSAPGGRELGEVVQRSPVRRVVGGSESASQKGRRGFKRSEAGARGGRRPPCRAHPAPSKGSKNKKKGFEETRATHATAVHDGGRWGGRATGGGVISQK